MAKLNLKRLTVADLVLLRDEVQVALSSRIELERRELQGKIDALTTLEGRHAVKSNGAGGGPASARNASPAKGKKAAPKYRGPGGELWAGRGLAPRWLTALEKKGKKRESFLIVR